MGALLRAWLAAVLTAAAIGFVGAAHAGDSPIAFNLAQARERENVKSFAPSVKRNSQKRRLSGQSVSPSLGISDGPADVREAMRWIGSGNFTGKPGAWCAWAVSAWLERTGHRPLASGMAASALSYGPRLSAPRVGALAVLSTRRGWAAHVGLVAGVKGDLIELISGNWGHRVSRALVPMRAFVAFIGV